MTMYILLVLSSLIFYIIKPKKTNFWFTIFAIILFIVSAFRYNVGTDYIHYQDIFYWISQGKETYVEIGYLMLNKLLIGLGFKSSISIFVVTSLVIIFSFCYSIKKFVPKKYWFFSLFLFITTGMMFASFNAIRQYFAIAITILGLPFLINRKYIIYIIYIILASLFHTSAFINIIYVILVKLFRDKKNSNILSIIFIISLIFLVIDIRNVIKLLSFIIPDRWLSYLNSATFLERNYSAILKQIIPNIIVLFILRNYSKLKEKNENFDIIFLGYYLACIINNSFFGILVLLRFGYFFDYFILFLVPIIIEYFNHKSTKNFVKILFIIYYIILTVVTIFMMNGQGVMPYKMIW